VPYPSRWTVSQVKSDIESLPARMAALEDDGFREFALYFGPRFRAFFLRRGLPEMEAEDLSVSCVTDVSLKIDKYDPHRGGHFDWEPRSSRARQQCLCFFPLPQG
jgi:hypothetical protein